MAFFLNQLTGQLRQSCVKAAVCCKRTCCCPWKCRNDIDSVSSKWGSTHYEHKLVPPQPKFTCFNSDRHFGVWLNKELNRLHWNVLSSGFLPRCFLQKIAKKIFSTVCSRAIRGEQWAGSLASGVVMVNPHIKPPHLNSNLLRHLRPVFVKAVSRQSHRMRTVRKWTATAWVSSAGGINPHTTWNNWKET